MNSRWPPWFLCWLFLLLGLAVSGSDDPRQAPQAVPEETPIRHVQAVFRGDTRPPATIEAEAGFFLAINPPPEERYGLREHLRYGKGSYGVFSSAYISNSAQMLSALRYASGRARPGTAVSYLYHIHAMPNMIEAAPSLSGHLSASAADVDEYDALGGIRWDQIIGWNTVPAHAAAQFLQAYTDDPYKDFTPNPGYRGEKYRHLRAGGPQPQLDDGETARKRVIEFMNRPGVSETVGWEPDAGFPLLRAPDHDQRMASAQMAAQKLSVEAKASGEAAAEARRERNAVKEALDFEGASAHFKAATDAVKEARQSTKIIAQICDYVCLRSEPWNQAFDSENAARAAAAEATIVVYSRFAKSYREEAQKASEKADADKADADAVKISGLKQDLSLQLLGKITAKDLVSNLLEKMTHELTFGRTGIGPEELEVDPKVVEAADIVWSWTRGNGLLSKVLDEAEVLIEEINKLRRAVEAIGQEGDAANKAAQKEEKNSKGRDRKKIRGPTTTEEHQAAEATKKVMGELDQLWAESNNGWWKKALATTAETVGAVGVSGLLTKAAAPASSSLGLGAALEGGPGAGIDTAFPVSRAESLAMSAAELDAYLKHAVADKMAESVARVAAKAGRGTEPALEGAGALGRRASVSTLDGQAAPSSQAALTPLIVRAAKVGIERAIVSAAAKMGIDESLG